jgi:outer membrane protein TolC
MRVTEFAAVKPTRRRAGARLPVAACVLALVTAWPGTAAAQSLPRVAGPLTMEQAVDLALERSLKVKAAGADSRAMESMRREALAPFWPQLSANGYFNDQRMAPNVFWSAGNTMARNYQVFTADQTLNGNVTAMYSLFAGGRDYYGYRAAAARADAAREMLRGTEVDVAMQARLDYVAALREADNARVADDLLQVVEERRRITIEMLEAGRVPRYYLLRDETERANAVQMTAMARARAEQAVVALKTTLGIDLASAVTLADRLEVTPVPITLEEAIRRATEEHPEVRAAVKQRQAAEAEVRAAYGNYFPQVGVGAMYDFASLKNQGSDREGDNGYSVGVVVTLPLFDGFMRENAVKTARARLDRTRQAVGLAQQQVAKEATQAALMLEAAEKSVEAAARAVEQAEEEYRIVDERLRSGRGIQVEVLDAQANRTRARFNEVAALADYQTALAMWRRAAGRPR